MSFILIKSYLNCDVKFCVKCGIMGYDLYLLSEVYRIAFKITGMLCFLTFLVLLSYSIIRHNHIFAQSIINPLNAELIPSAICWHY